MIEIGTEKVVDGVIWVAKQVVDPDIAAKRIDNTANRSDANYYKAQQNQKKRTMKKMERQKRRRNDFSSVSTIMRRVDTNQVLKDLVRFVDVIDEEDGDLIESYIEKYLRFVDKE